MIGGRISKAKTLHTSQVFSQAQRRVNFMGNVKLALVMPATSNNRSPTVVSPTV
jgi:hypothetical protein